MGEAHSLCSDRIAEMSARMRQEVCGKDAKRVQP